MRAIDEYHILYEKSKIWDKNSWFGVPCWKLPFDAFVIQELIVRLRPEFIIETGTGCGGSAMFYASICELLGEGKVITVDIESKVDHSKIELNTVITVPVVSSHLLYSIIYCTMNIPICHPALPRVDHIKNTPIN